MKASGRGAVRRIVRVRKWITPAMLIAVAAYTASCGGSPPTAPPPIVQPPPVVQPPPPPPPPPTTGATRVLAFGDSMTAGTTSPPMMFRALTAGLAQSYPFKLQSLMAALYAAQSVEVFNAGIAGRRASEDRQRFIDAVSEARPNVVFLLEGANDFNQPFATGESVNDRINTTVGNLEEMVKHAVARGLPIFVGTLPPQRPGGRLSGAVDYLDRANDAVRVMAGKKGAEVIEFSQLPLSLVGQDGLHPTEAGYQRMAEIVMDVLRSRYETAPSASR